MMEKRLDLKISDELYWKVKNLARSLNQSLGKTVRDILSKELKEAEVSNE